MFGLPHLLGISALAALLAFGLGYIKGDADAASRYQVRIARMQLDAKEAAEADQQKRQQAFIDAANGYEVTNAQARVVYRTITRDVDKIVERDVYRDRCLDDDGLRLAQLALGGIAVTPSDPAKPDTGMPDADTPR
jgi:hypothetical protein